VRHEQLVDGRLGCAGFAAALLTDVDDSRRWGTVVGQDLRAYQAISDDDIGALQPAQGLDR